MHNRKWAKVSIYTTKESFIVSTKPKFNFKQILYHNENVTIRDMINSISAPHIHSAQNDGSIATPEMILQVY